MQRSIAATVATVSLLGRRGLLAGSGASLFGGTFTGSLMRLIRLTDHDEWNNFSTHPSVAAHKPERTDKPSVQSLPSPVPAGTATTARQWPYMIRRKAAAAVRIKARAVIKAKQLILDEKTAAEKIKRRVAASNAAAKSRAWIRNCKLQVKAVADKERLRAKMQRAKDVATQRAALIVKRAPSAYALYVKDRYMALGHLPAAQRFQTIGAEFKELKPDMKQAYEVTAAKLKAEVYAKRAVIAATRVQRPITGYMVFFGVKYRQIKTADQAARTVDIARLIGKQWLALSESDKQVFKAQAASKKATAAIV